MSAPLSSSVVRGLVALCALMLLVLVARAAPAQADAFGSQFTISSPNHVSNGSQATMPDVAYNSATGQYLVVYVGATTPVEDDVYGQLVDAEGRLVGPEIRISETSGEHEEYSPPAVGYDSDSGRYLVAWDHEETVNVRLVSADGAPLGNEAPISAVQSDIETEAIAYSPVTREYLVVWKAFSDGRVFVQRLNQEAAQVGPDDLIVGGSDTLQVDDAVDVAYNATSLEYLVVFGADSDLANDGEEVYGQRLDLGGAQIGADDFQISSMGPSDDSGFNAAPPSVAWNSVLNQYLVAWHGNDGPPLAPKEREAYGQLLAADGTPIGADDFRISDLGPDGSAEYNAFRPRIAFDQFSNQYLVTWHGGEIGLGEEEFEVWGQYLAADGAEIGTNDFRISEVLPDGDNDFSANRPALAFNPKACDYLVTYFSGDLNDSGEAFSAVLGRRVSAPPACPKPPAPAPNAAPVISGLRIGPKAIASGIAAPKGKGKAPRGKAGAKASKESAAKQAKAQYSLSEPAAVVFTVERKVSGRKAKGKCRKAKGAKASGRRCALWVKTGRTLSQQGNAGANALSFSAKSIRKRGLRPGAYRIAAVATDAQGGKSATALASFRVVGSK